MRYLQKKNLPIITDGAFIINLDDKERKRTYWVLLFIDRNVAVYLGSFAIEYIPQEIVSKIKNKSIAYNIFRIQDDDSIMCGFYCDALVKYMFAGRTLLDNYYLFFPNDYKNNEKII